MEDDTFFEDSMSPDVETPDPNTPGSLAEPEQGQKKKRKAWGQPIPDYKVVLPPRKRAKTAEEKEQRKNERVIRNRKAADKSRQRQKAAYAELEITKAQMEQENAALREALARYQATFGDLPGVSHSIPNSVQANHVSSQPSQPTLSDAGATNIYFEANQQIPIGLENSSISSPVPTLSVDSPLLSQSMERSTSLTPSLFPPQDLPNTSLNEQQLLIPSLSDFKEVSNLTQYPAAVLCDLQCQLENSLNSNMQLEKAQRFHFHLSLINITILMTIYETFSNTMLVPMIQMFQTLARSLSTTSTELDLVDHYFPLIHSLISMPSSTTTRPIFRMKLLSRLLACSPSSARLIKAATDRALQRVVSDESILADPEAGRHWASLLTTKWAIQSVEREHQRYRLMVDSTQDSSNGICGLAQDLESNKMEGVDYAAIEQSIWRWRAENLDGSVGETCVSGPDVH